MTVGSEGAQTMDTMPREERRRLDRDDAKDAIHESLEHLSAFLKRNPDRLMITLRSNETNDVLRLPREVVELLGEILAHMDAGRSVQIIPDHAELTTQQAADVLNVSRPYLVKLLQTGEIDYHMVGTHRRVPFKSLMEFKTKDDRRRRANADELARLSSELGA